MTGPTGAATSVSWGALRKTAEDATKPLPVDWYDVVVVKAEHKVASTGSNMVSATMEVTSGPHKTRRLFTNFVLTPENGFALGIFFRNMAAFGIDDAFFAQLEQYPVEQGMQLLADTLMNRTARVKVGIRKWQGQDRNECQEFQLVTGGPTAPGVVAGPAVVGGPSGGPTPPLTPAQSPSVPTVGSAPSAPQSVPQVPGPPAPPQPAF